MKRKLIVTLLSVIIIPYFAIANDYEDAWKALHRNDRKTARLLLEKALKDPKTAVDAYLTIVYLHLFEGKESEATEFLPMVYEKVKDPNPYCFALWFNGAVLGSLGKKSKPHQLALLNKILSDDKVNGSIRAAAHYAKGMHYLYINEFEKSKEEYAGLQSAVNWQFVGPFDNLQGSGFNKTFGPVEHPEASAVFTSVNNAEIKWFTPTHEAEEGWTYPFPHIRYSTAVIYGQTFVKAPADMKVLLNAGGSGNLKVWVNDELVLSESKERITELDTYNNYVELKKGYNRLLVQLGYVDKSFPNYIIRFTDDRFYPVKGLSYSSEVQPYTKAKGGRILQSVPHFAEAFFEQKIKAEPENYINYIMLSQTYLRNKKNSEARKVIESALKKIPDNSLLRFELLQCLSNESNRTLVAQELERIKEKDPFCLLTYELEIQRLISEKKYDEALTEIDKRDKLFGVSGMSMSNRITIYGEQNKMEELIAEIKKAYEKYPDDPEYVKMMFRLQKSAYKDTKAAIKVYEDFLKRNYNFSIMESLSEEYFEQGKAERGLDIRNKLVKLFPYDADLIVEVVKYYFSKQQYKDALELCQQTLKLAPFVAAYHDNVGLMYEQMGKKKEAIEAYKKALYYDRNRFSTRYKIRSLENKEDIYKAFPQTDPYEVIRNAKDSNDAEHDFTYLLDEKFSVVYPERATEEYGTIIVKVHNQKGIDAWKESSIPYDGGSQVLTVEKAEVVKPGGSKTPAETNGNDIVFTGLQEGDAILIKYKLQNYYSGRLGREYWARYTFDAFVPCKVSRYSMLIADNIPFNYKVLNANLEPTVTSFENFKLYTWQMNDVPAVKDEPLMPSIGDVGRVLHISTVKSWDDISKWYSDLVTLAMKDDYEVKEVYNELFADGKKRTQREKAGIIYNYILKNISYSSVSFRQSGLIPQKPSTTINTRLGDCKDLSTLFVSLANLAGLDAELVLVDTRDQGQKQMILPSMEFNHCIVKATIDGKEQYIELTDGNLPFGSLPNSLYEALSLEIPKQTEKISGSSLKQIKTHNRTTDRVTRNMTVDIDGTDLKIDAKVTKTGALTSGVRDQYVSLSDEKRREELEKSVGNGYKNTVKVEKASFTGLDKLVDSVSYTYNFSVKNEVVEVGDMGMIKVPFTDVIATLDNFSIDNRKFPIEYYSYENTDEYETVIRIRAPKGKTFFEIPRDESMSFKNCKYSIRFIKNQPDEVTVVRKATLIRDNIAPADYGAFQDFFNKIVKVESKYIGFK